MEDNTQTNPKSRLMALNALESSPGWPVFCERVSQIVAVEIDVKVWDIKTTDEERRNLVNARKLLTESFSPQKMLGSMQAAARTEVERVEQARVRQQKSA
jgi:hypothetical protein